MRALCGNGLQKRRDASSAHAVALRTLLSVLRLAQQQQMHRKQNKKASKQKAWREVIALGLIKSKRQFVWCEVIRGEAVAVGQHNGT